jgi:4-amino-4-deoxy-L-arabinose transferase-like glycosyltransferase
VSRPGGLGGGLYSPTYIYTLLVWTRVFGISVSSLRGMSAAFSILAVVGLGLLARLLTDRRAARLAMVAAALSPWSFQVSRLAVDAPMAPALLVWGVYLFLRSPRAPWAAASGAVLTIAAYTYSPVRLQVTLLCVFLLVLERKRLRPARVVAFLGTMVVLGLPLALAILNGTVLGRARALSILTVDYIEAHRGHLTPVSFVVKQMLENLFEHLRPSFLFFTGDANLRHSTQIMGELGWLDILALACSSVALGALIWRAYRPTAGPWAPPAKNWLVAGAAVVVGAFGTLPAALCWEGLPHALRSMTVWPSVALFTGVTLSAVWSRSRVVPVLALALALAQTVHFVPYYFHVYPKESYVAWDGELREAADARDPARFAAVARRYPELGFRYYLLRDFGATCDSSGARAQQIVTGK